MGDNIDILARLPTFDQMLLIAPITFIVLSVLLIGVGVTYFLMSAHIRSLRDIIDYFKTK